MPKDGQAEQQTRRVGNRDPRRDPREGDILRDSFGQVHVFHEERGPGQKLDLGEWRRIMRGAIVLRCLPLVDPPPGWSR